MKAIMLAALAAFLTSCAVTIDPQTGQPVIILDPEAVVTITQEVVSEINEELTQEGGK